MLLFRFLLPLLVRNHIHVLGHNGVSAGAHRDYVSFIDRPGRGLVKYLPFLFCVVSILAGQQLEELCLKRAIFERGEPSDNLEAEQGP